LVTPLQFGEGPGVRLKNGKFSPYKKVKPFWQPGFFRRDWMKNENLIFNDKP